MRFGVLIGLLLFLGQQAPAKESKPATCQAAEYRQFDFWLGDWDAYDAGDPTAVAARTRVDSILDGCVLWEQYEDPTGQKGQSFSSYDAGRRVWHQTWVTNRGELLIIEGTMKDGEMLLSGSDHPEPGTTRLVRGSWKPVKDGVREVAFRSLDGGKTWKQWFDITFRKHH